MKVGLLITTFNRPEYLQECLNSVEVAYIPVETEIVIIDDCSTDITTKELISAFHHRNLSAVIWKHENKSIKDSLLKGCDYLFGLGCDHICNLDADALVHSSFLTTLCNLKERFPDHIVTGFNCLTRNRDGSERHKVLMTGEGFNLKKSVGGINMMFNKQQYIAWIRPALIRCLASQGNWDHQACIAAERDGKEIVCAVPSVVQHIGVSSSMGHSLSEPPDVATDFVLPSYLEMRRDKMGFSFRSLHLPSVTLVGADCVDVRRLLRAAEISQRDIQFGDVKIFSSVVLDNRVTYIPPMLTKSHYSVFMMKELWKHIHTSHILVIQYDGFVLNYKAWREEWLQYDYIGAPWEWYTDGMNIGNGGFSLRSKKLHDALGQDNDIIPLNDGKIPTYHHEEDHNICRMYRKYLERQYGIKFAPIEEARKFSIEGWRSNNRTWNGEFGFHSKGVDISKSKITV
jgi:glycosyltransferase involved in cell wall biosynthesis